MNILITKVYKAFLRSLKVSKKNLYFESYDRFNDNSYALFKYINNNYPKYNTFYHCYSKEQYINGIKRGIPRKKLIGYIQEKSKIKRIIKKIKDDITFEKCSIAFISYLGDKYKKSNNISKKRKIVFLWHGTFPLKIVNGLYEYHFPFPNNFYKTHPTEFCKQKMIEYYPGLQNATNVICGKPRYDLIMRPNKDGLFKIIGEQANKKIILFACTFKNFHEDATNYFSKEFPLHFSTSEWESINNFLISKDIILFIKAHHAHNANKDYLHFSNIIIKDQSDFDNAFVQIEEIMKLTCGLITDYSSIYYDYLLTKNPVAFIETNDNELFEIGNGSFSEELSSYRIGDKIYDISSFVNAINNMTEGKCVNYHDKWEKISDLVNGDYKDNNCQSVCDMFLEK